MTRYYEALTRVRVKHTARGTQKEYPAANWIPRFGEVVILLHSVVSGSLDVVDVIRKDGLGGLETIYGFNIERGLPKQKRPPCLRYSFTVEGEGNFPIRLLARCCAWPEDGQQAYTMLGTHRRIVYLESCFMPNKQLWADVHWTLTLNDAQPLNRE